MKKTYADECLERADKATNGPWTIKTRNMKYYNEDGSQKSLEEIAKISADESDDEWLGASVLGPPEPGREAFLVKDALFICHARTDVPELAKRLNKAINTIRDSISKYHMATDQYKELFDLCSELEAPLT